MCGIFGVVSRGAPLSADFLPKAARSLAHRGPDDSGTILLNVKDQQIGLAHTRLSIIDLSPLGHQPMQDAATGNWLVFNGEIYNFREIRAELEATGNRFQSHSDTEVILAAYRTWGAESFVRLRGMFALALWDATRQTLHLVRDPMGIKPLYYYDSSSSFLFASEVRTLLGTGLVPRKIDPDGVFSFLAFGSVYEPRTIIEGVCAVPPGHVVTLEKGRVSYREYWNPLKLGGHAPAVEDRAADDRAAAKNLPGLLRDAVLSHLVSDV